MSQRPWLFLAISTPPPRCSLHPRQGEGGQQGLSSDVGSEDSCPFPSAGGTRCPKHMSAVRDTDSYMGLFRLPSSPFPSHSCGRATINNEKAPFWAQELSNFLIQNAFLLPGPLIFLWFRRKAAPWPSFLLPQGIKERLGSHPSEQKILVFRVNFSM